jgi:8-oxo-dGTP pyrophosphatase MutT (NUDIX family)
MQNVATEYSAGGVMVEGRSVLVIRTRTRGGRSIWTFPKGRLKAGESKREAAVREVFEETGYTCELTAPLGTTTYWFRRGGRRIKKTVQWFFGYPIAKAGRFNPGEVDEVRWVPLLEAYSKLSHQGDRQLLARAEEHLADPGSHSSLAG